jgi:hypothetical protein
MKIESEYLSIASLLISIFTFLFMWIKFVIGIKEDIKRLQTQIEPFWKMVETEVPRILHSPHTPETDKLLEQLENGCLFTLEDILDLKCAIKEALQKGEYSPGRRFPAALLVKRLEMLEADKIKELSRLPRNEVKECLIKK